MSPIPNRILAPQPVIVSVELAPVYNILNSIAALEKVEAYSGLDEWVVRTTARLSSDQQRRHELLFWGIGLEALADLVEPGIVESFPAYLDSLETHDPVALRDRLLRRIADSPHRRVYAETPPMPPPDISRLLEDRDYFLDYFGAFGKPLHSAVEAIHYLLNDPPALQSVIVETLREFWQQYVLTEWERIRPVLQESVDALCQIDTAGMSIFEAMQAITGRNLRSIFNASELTRYSQVRFIPSRHTGPYIVWFGNQTILSIIFSARLPRGARQLQSPLDTTELINRLNALADETRLKILLAVKQHGELSTQQIIDIFDLDKSAASRHLRLLYATSLLNERRDDDGKRKFYSLNPHCADEITETIHILLRQ